MLAEKVIDVVGLCHNPPKKAAVSCVAEKSQVQALDRYQPVLPMPGMPGRRTHDRARHGVTSLLAAFSIADGTVISGGDEPGPGLFGGRAGRWDMPILGASFTAC